MFWALAIILFGSVTLIHYRDRAKAERLRAAILIKYALFRAKLNAQEQARFDAIAQRFVREKEWVGQDIEVVEEMKVMIGACAAQLLLHLPDVPLDHFTRIVIHRGHFRSLRTARMHVGETHPLAGEVVISWRDFVFGYGLSHDAQNVGLHELAHALWFENLFLGDRCAAWTDALVAQWKSLAEAEIAAIKRGESRLLSAYAGTNQAEFFAVAVEYFFEQPDAFREKLPALFDTLKELLRQDPTT